MTYYSSSPSRPKTLMEVLLARKIEAAAAQASGSTSDPTKLFRNDSFDSVSSLGSLSSIVLGDDVCRCDDCLLGIVDLWIAGPAEKALFKKKVLDILFIHFFSIWHSIQLANRSEYVLDFFAFIDVIRNKWCSNHKFATTLHLYAN